MKNNNLVIYTYQNKDGKSINKPQVISKIEKIIPYHQKTKSNFSFTNKTQLKNCLTVPNQPENENKRVKTANTVKTPQKFKNKSNKDQATKSKNENKNIKIVNEDNIDKKSLTTNSSKFFTKTIKNSKSSSYFNKTISSKPKKYREFSKEKIEHSIGEIIKLKEHISELVFQPNDLDAQKKEIITYFQNKIDELNEIKNGLLNERNVYDIQTLGLQSHFDKLKNKYNDLLHTLEVKTKELDEVKGLYLNRKNNFEANSKNEIFIVENYYASLISSKLETNEEINETLTIGEIQDISFILRIILGHLGISIEQVLSELFVNEEDSTLSDIVEHLYNLISDNCTNPKTKSILYSYCSNLGCLTFQNKQSGISSIKSSKRNSTNISREILFEDNFSIEKLKLNLIEQIGTIPVYTPELVPIYREKIKKIMEKCQDDLIHFCRENDIENKGIVSFNNFKAFLNSCNKMEFNYYTKAHKEILEYIFFIMKERNLIKTFHFYDLNYDNLWSIFKDEEYGNEICEEFLMNIKNYLLSRRISFQEFISPIANHIKLDNDTMFVEKKIFEFYLKIKKIIRTYQILPDNDSMINLTELIVIFDNNQS